MHSESEIRGIMGWNSGHARFRGESSGIIAGRYALTKRLSAGWPRSIGPLSSGTLNVGSEPFWGDPSVFEGSRRPSIPEGQGPSIPDVCRSKDGLPLKNPTTAADSGAAVVRCRPPSYDSGRPPWLSVQERGPR
jgi:hypothetical protein